LPDIAYVNGRFCPIEQAVVSIEDRGLQFGDSVYEVMRAYAGQIFALGQHLDRFTRSSRLIHLNADDFLAELPGLLEEALRQSTYGDAILYVQLTRGAAQRSHSIPADILPTRIITVRPMEDSYAAEQAEGVSAVGLQDIRWAHCDIKSTNLLAGVLLKYEARQAGAFEAILFNERGELTEGASSNVFVVIDGVLRTPELSERILAGVTRLRLLELARQDGIPVRSGVLSREDMAGADEVFVASTSIEVIPVVRFDGKPIGSGQPGPITRRLHELYREMARRPAGD
jgi:D-alanine transaminase